VKVQRTWLEARIITSRLNDWCDDEAACREKASEYGIILDEQAIEREVTKRRVARKRRQGNVQLRDQRV